MSGLRWAAVAAAALVAACSGTGGGPGPESPDGTPSVDVGSPVSGEISFMTFGDPEELAAYRSLIEAFEEAEPDVEVGFVPTSDRDDLIARLSTAFSGGRPPDLFLMNYRYYGQFHAKGVLEPLQPYLDASSLFEAEDFYAPAMEAFIEDGRQICMPQNISSLVVYYNRDLFREAGLSDPRPGWGWRDFAQAALTLTRDTDGDGTTDQFGVGVEPEVIRLAPFIWSNGGSLVDDEERPTRFTVDTPEALQAMTEFFNLHNVYGVTPSDEEAESEDNETRFKNGTMAMVLSSRRETPTFRTITGFDWDVAQLPQHREPAGILHSDAYCLTTASQNKAAAWRFVEFALGPEGAPIVAETGRTVPSLIEVAESEAFLDPDQRPANSRVFLDTIPVIRRVPNISTWPEIEDAAAAILEQGFYEGAGAEEVAQMLITQTTPIFARGE